MSIELVIAVLMAGVAILVGFAGPAPTGPAPKGARADEARDATGLPVRSTTATPEP